MTFTAWFTGPPAAGKTTLARAVADRLAARGCAAVVLDADDLRSELWPELGYDARGRDENTRRLAALAARVNAGGSPALVAAVAPARAHRDRARGLIPRFAEVHVTAPPALLRARDPKGLYARAAAGAAVDVPGVHIEYEPPHAPEVALDTSRAGAAECAAQVVEWLVARGWAKER